MPAIEASHAPAAPPSRNIGGAYCPEIERALWTRADPRKLYDAILFVRETSPAQRRSTAAYLTESFGLEQSTTTESMRNLDFTSGSGRHLELAQLTGAICPGDDNVYRPGLWIVLRDPSEKPTLPLCHLAQQRVSAIVEEFVSRMGL